MSSAVEHFQAALTELGQALLVVEHAYDITAEEWPEVARTLQDIRRTLTRIDLRLEGKT